MKNYYKLCILFLLTALLPSCSIVMATKKMGPDVAKVQSARTKAQLLTCGAHLVSSQHDYYGNLIETYLIPQEKNAGIRAVLHGCLDLFTMGFWELFGTPLEALTPTGSFSIRVIYDHTDCIQKIELL